MALSLSLETRVRGSNLLFTIRIRVEWTDVVIFLLLEIRENRLPGAPHPAYCFNPSLVFSPLSRPLSCHEMERAPAFV